MGVRRRQEGLAVSSVLLRAPSNCMDKESVMDKKFLSAGQVAAYIQSPWRAADLVRPMLEIQAKYEALGGAGGFLGPQISDVLPDPNFGWYQNYAGGVIEWSETTGAHEVHGAILAKWLEVSAALGVLGYPTTDETSAADGTGRFNHFERGSIYWTPAGGAHEVHGAIHGKWASLGWEWGLLGYPVTDETPTPDGLGRFNHFDNGSIYWTGATGACEIHGAIRERWADMGWERSILGYPASDEVPQWGTGAIQLFQHGSLWWTPSSGVQVKPADEPDNPETIVFRSGEIATDTVSGWAELWVNDQGYWHYKGHVHDSAFFGDSYTMGTILEFGDEANRVAGASHSGTLQGTVALGDRDDDWADSGWNDLIRDNWGLIRDRGKATTALHQATSGLDVLEGILVGLPIAVLGAILVALIASPDTTCNTQAYGPNTGQGGSLNCQGGGSGQ